MSGSDPTGLIVLDKPRGLTSRDAVDRAQRWLPRGTKVGHTGTLDPLATGVLVLCVGAATRLAEYVQRMRKTYRSTFLLGCRSDTDDADGTVSPVSVERIPSEVEVRTALAEFVGNLDQTPPAFSAAKVSGRRAYDLARRGEAVELLPRRVTVYDIDVLSFAWPRLQIEVRCGKGTYIRSLRGDLGEQLRCGGLVEELRRTRVGPFEASAAPPLDTDAATALATLRPLREAVTELPTVVLASSDAERLRRGQAIPWSPLPEGEEAAAVSESGELVAVVKIDCDAKRLRPDKVLPP